MKLDLEIDEITLHGSPDEPITAEAIIEAAEAELERLAAVFGAPTHDLDIQLDGLVLEVESGVTARMLGERIAVDIASRWRGLGSTAGTAEAPDPTAGLDGDGSAKIE